MRKCLGFVCCLILGIIADAAADAGYSNRFTVINLPAGYSSRFSIDNNAPAAITPTPTPSSALLTVERVLPAYYSPNNIYTITLNIKVNTGFYIEFALADYLPANWSIVSYSVDINAYDDIAFSWSGNYTTAYWLVGISAPGNYTLSYNVFVPSGDAGDKVFSGYYNIYFYYLVNIVSNNVDIAGDSSIGASAPAPTNTPTRTPTNTIARTPTRTPTLTPKPTPTLTSTYTPTRTPTLTPTPTPTSTFTPTAVPTAMPSIVVPLPGLPEDAKPLEMVLIPAGTFMMGSPDNEQDRDSDEGPQHQVSLTQAFYIGKYEVTQAQWQAVMGSNPAQGFGVGSNYPAYYFTWNDSQTFIQKLNQLGQGTFRLPTEAEWEYACRTGTTTRFYWGDDANYILINDYAWQEGNNSPYRSKEVGLKAPNAFGLHDMSGNVWEWCQDWYGNYAAAAQMDPIGPSDGLYRISRGGDWGENAKRCRSAARSWNGQDVRYTNIGFRLTLSRSDAITPIPTSTYTPTAIPTALPSIIVPLPNLPVGAKPLEMVLIPAGTFMMGSPDSELDRQSDEGPQHKVTLTKPYYIGKYEVTQAQWQAMMGNNPSKWIGNNLPVEQESWNDCQTFIQKLNQMDQGTFRLPTEAEWEYACRAGTQTRFYWGDDPNYTQIGEYAWNSGNSSSKTHDVGLKKPNAWGLYDISGNVLEWCQDWYGNYSADAQNNPTGPNSGSGRVLRGGDWVSPDWNFRSSSRDGFRQDLGGGATIGLRLVLSKTNAITPTPMLTFTPTSIPTSTPSYTPMTTNTPTFTVAPTYTPTSTSTPGSVVVRVDFAVKVYDANTFQPIKDVFVILADPPMNVKTNASGAAILSQIPQGRIHLTILISAYETKEIDIDVNAQNTNTTVYLVPLTGPALTPTPTLAAAPSITPAPTFTSTPKPEDILTLFVVSLNRLIELYGQEKATELFELLKILLTHETVRGEVLNLDQYTSVRDKYKAWDADSNLMYLGTKTDGQDNIRLANAVAEDVKAIIGAKRIEQKYAKVKYLVIIGSDAAIPFYRVENQSRTANSEFNYYKKLDQTHPLSIALRQDRILTDDYYADSTPSWMKSDLEKELYLPNDLLVGRLVETPEEMSAMIDAYIANNGQIDFNKALVAGSDSYTNGADLAAQILSSDLGRVNRLPEGDDSFELVTALNKNSPLNLLGLHGTHDKIYRTKMISPLSAKTAKSNLQALLGSIVLNWGGHGGLNLDRRIANPTKEYDNFTDVFMKTGVGAYLGTTAFAGSSLESIGFTELLGLRFIDALISGTASMTVGEAYQKAKREYWLNESNGLADSNLSLEEVKQNISDDAKVLSGLILYGLPMFRVTSSEQGKVNPLSEKTYISPFAMKPMKVEPKAVTGSLFQVQLGAALEDNYMKENQTGAGRYYAFNGVTQTNVNEPIQPRIGFYTGAESFFPKGAVLESAKYITISNFDPVIEGGAWGEENVSEGVFEKQGYFPAIPFTVNTIPQQGSVPPLQKFVFIAGQYNKDKQTERLYTDVKYSTYYTGEKTDAIAPTILEPFMKTDSDAQVSVQGWDQNNGPLYRVILTWTDGEGEWKALDMTKSNANPKEWQARLAYNPDMEFFIQAVDALGNVKYLDNQGQYYKPAPPTSIDLYALLKLTVEGF